MKPTRVSYRCNTCFQKYKTIDEIYDHLKTHTSETDGVSNRPQGIVIPLDQGPSDRSDPSLLPAGSMVDELQSRLASFYNGETEGNIETNASHKGARNSADGTNARLEGVRYPGDVRVTCILKTWS